MILVAPLSLAGQTEAQFQRLQQERREFFTRELELTETESEAFWPIYNDLQNRKMKIMEEERNLMRYMRENAPNMNDQEIRKNLDKVHSLRDSMGSLEKEFYGSKFPEILPLKKVMKLYLVEIDFRRHLMHEIRGRGQGGPGKARFHSQGRRDQLPAPGE